MSEQNVYIGPERRWIPRYLTAGPLEIPFVTRGQALRTIDRSFYDRAQICLAFCNANTMLKALESRSFAKTLSQFLLLNDGVGLDLCSLILARRTFDDNLNGTDFIPDLIKYASIDLKIFLLGGEPGIAERAAEGLAALEPRHRIVGTHHGYFDERDASGIVDSINAAAPDLLLVALGNPQQEMFISRYRGRLRVPVLIGVGAFLDYMAGKVKRAPKAIRSLRFEWLFRLLQEPRRLGSRYTIGILRFGFAVLRLRWTAVTDGNSAQADLSSRRLRPEAGRYPQDWPDALTCRAYKEPDPSHKMRHVVKCES